MIYLDTCMVIYAVEDSGARGDAVRAAMRREASSVFAVSPLVRMECLVGPLRAGDLLLEDRFRTALDLFQQLDLAPETFERAARLRALHGLRTPDALHLAAAQLHACSALWTNDDRLATASQGLAVDVVHRSL